MKLKNTTDIDDKAINAIISKACTFWRRNLGVPFYKKHIKETRIRNRRSGFSGYAWWAGPRSNEITCSIGKHEGNDKRMKNALHIIGHEVGHLAIHFAEDNHGRRYTRHNGRSGGGDEEFVDRMARKFMEECAN